MNFVRRHAIGLLALFVALGGSAMAVTVGGGSSKAPSAHAAKKKKKKIKVVVGPQGPKGDQGAPGANGTDGTGAPGAPGAPGASMLTSAGPTTLVLNGPASPTPAYLPLSGLLTAGDGTPSSAAVTQTFPGAMTITAMRGEAVTTTAVSGQPIPLPIEAQLFKGASGAAPVASGPPCTATPMVPPAVPIPIGSTFTFSCTGLSIPVAAGDHGYVALTLVSQGAGFFFTLNLQSSIGLKGS